MTHNRSSAVMQQRSEPHDSLPVISLEQALALGQRWYFTGKCCPKGHFAKRSVSNRDCRACENERRADRRAAQPETTRAKDRASYAARAVVKRALMKASRARHIEKRRAEDRARYRANPERYKANAVKWGRENLGKRVAIVAARRMKIRKATPPWQSKEQASEIRALYLEAAARPGEWHIDHIVPINGKDVCGLHVPWNLQILSGDENRKKGRRYGAE